VFAHPWIALTLALLASTLVALLLWWVWRKLFGRTPRPGAA
jgi:hypothetical protein